MLSAPQSLAALPWFARLPAASVIQPMLFKSPLGPVQQSQPGVHFAYLMPNGDPVWSMKIVADEIRVECSQYTRWAKIWSYARELITQAHDKLREADSTPLVDRVTLQVVDSFVGAGSGYDARELLRENGRLGSVPFASGDLWHVFCGWFAQRDWGRILNNLNVQAKGQHPASPGQIDREPYTVSITHMQKALLATPLSSDLHKIDSVMEFLHLENKAALASVLNDNALSQIGMPSVTR